MGERVILTAAPEAEHAALGELWREGVPVFRCAGVHEKSFPHRHTPPSEHRTPGPCRLAPGILRCALPGTFTELAEAFRERPPLFVRHLQPVDREVALAGDLGDLERLEAAALELAPRL